MAGQLFNKKIECTIQDNILDVINIFFSSQPIFSFNVFRDAADVGGEVDDKERDIKRGGSVLFEVKMFLCKDQENSFNIY